MLIHSIKAENFMRFSRLEVMGLPSRGLIGLEGPNESGKSTMGEALLFAFFGRTRVSHGATVTSLIRWEAETMSVTVEFSVGAPGDRAEEFLIFRQVDRYGTHYVKVLELTGRSEVAVGNLQTAEFLARKVRFGFDEFHQSFYHDQHQVRRVPVAQVEFFESAIGIKHIREAAEDLRRELEPLEREFGHFQKEIARNLVQVDRHEKNVVKLPDLGCRSAKLLVSIDGQSRLSPDLRQKAEARRAEAAVIDARVRRLPELAQLPHASWAAEITKLLGADNGGPAAQDPALQDDAQVRAVGDSYKRLRLLHGFSRDVAALVEEIGAERDALARRLDARVHDSPAALLASLEERDVHLGRRSAIALLAATASILCTALLTGLFFVLDRAGTPPPDWLPEVLRAQDPWKLAVAPVVSAIIALLLVGAVRRRRGERRALAEERERLQAATGDLGKAYAELNALLVASSGRDVPRILSGAAASGVPGVAARASTILSQSAAIRDPGKEGAVEKGLQAHSRADSDLRARLLSDAQKLEKEAQEEDAGLKKLQAEKERLESEVRECQAQLAKKEGLLARNKDLEASAAAVRSEVDLRLLACRLLDETASSLRSRVGPGLTRFVKGILPLLTLGRYRDVRVENDLEIKLFSAEKNDFLAIHELSGGTQEALSLALRIAVSQAFVAARTCQAQFFFLDEPFKMMDSARRVETLRALPRLSSHLEQVFVVQPDFGPEERSLFDCTIRTAHGERDLVVDMGRCRAGRGVPVQGGGSPPRGGDEVGDGEPRASAAEGPDPSPHVVEA